MPFWNLLHINSQKLTDYISIESEALDILQTFHVYTSEALVHPCVRELQKKKQRKLLHLFNE